MSGPIRAVFALREFRLFILARIVASLAMPMVMVAVGWTIYDLTNNPVDLGYVGLTLFLPQILLTLPAGHLADRFDRRSLIQLAFALMVLAALLLTGLAIGGISRPGPIFAVMLLIATANAVIRPATQSLLPLLVPRDRLSAAVAFNSSTWQIAGTVGPAFGGFLYGFGAVFVYATVTALFLLALLLIGRLQHRPPLPLPGGDRTMERLLAGIQFVRQRPILLGAVSLDLFAVLLGGATALLPVYARDILQVGPMGLGLLRSASAVGAVLCAVTLAHRPLKHRVGRIMFAAVALYGIATIVFGLSRWLPLSLLALAVLGASDMVSVYVRQNLVQLNTPDAMRGRVSAVSMVFVGASNELGEFESGMTAGWFGTIPAVVLGGAGTLLVVGIWCVAFKPLRQVDKLEWA